MLSTAYTLCAVPLLFILSFVAKGAMTCALLVAVWLGVGAVGEILFKGTKRPHVKTPTVKPVAKFD